MTDPNKTSLQTYLQTLAYPAPRPNAAPDPAITAAGRRDQYIARLTPLKDRLRIALEKFPSELLAQGVHMSQLWPLVIGVQRSKPRAFEIAAALRELNWSRVRFYSDGTAPSGSFWFPPEVDTAEAKAILKARKV